MSSESVDRAACAFCGRERSDHRADAYCSDGCRDVDAALGSPPAQSHDEPSGVGDRTFLRIDGMHAATCESYLEFVAERIDGVREAQASYVSESIRVDHDPDRVTPERIRDGLSTLGYTAHLRSDVGDAPTRSGTPERDETAIRRERDDVVLEMRYIAGIVFGTFLLIPYVSIIYPIHLASFVDWGALHPLEDAFRLDGTGGFLFLRLYLVLTGVILVFTALPVLRGAYISLRMRQPNTHLLVGITIIGAYLYSAIAVVLGRNDIYFDLTVVVAAAVMGMIYYESSIKREALGRLTDLTVSRVETARRVGPDGATTAVDADALAPGDEVLVRAGERIPVDGAVVGDGCTVDEAVVTGESLPVRKRAGEAVVGGSLVTADAARIRVGADAASGIDRLIDAVWTRRSAEHGTQRRADHLAGLAIIAVIAAAVVTGGVAVLLDVQPSRIALLITASALVTSPWALGLATPLSVATILRAGLDRGIVVFDDTVFERLRGIDQLVLDKTGTLTTGDMAVIDADAPADLLRQVVAVERRAAHPAADAIVTALDRGDALEVDGFTTHGNGVSGVVEGEDVLVGNLVRFEEEGWDVPTHVRSRVHDVRGMGRLPVIVGRDGTAGGVIVLGDEPRTGWDETISRLGAQGIEITVLTGDDASATASFADHDRVTHVFAGVPPAGKTATIRSLATDGTVAMVGDGTNDAPALAAADLGISMGGGTALAAAAADIAIADDDIATVDDVFALAASARRRVRTNLGLALSFNAIAVPLALLGLFNPLTAAVALVVCGGLVAANGSRTLLDG